MNNHELSGASEKLQAKTEWDNLGEEVDFSDAESVDFDIENFVEDTYGDKATTLFLNSCFEGEDITNTDHYVTSNLLDNILTNDEQVRMIDKYAETQTIDDELAKKMTKAISEQMELVTEDFLEEIKTDPFMRKRHASEIAGRDNDDLGEDENFLYEILTRADDGFYGSKEARNLFGDEDYLTSKYKKALENQEKRIEEGTSDINRDEFLKNINSSLNLMVDENMATMEELISDPYLRERHFNALVASDWNEIPSEVRELWDADTDFFDSYEYGSMLRKKVYENPDIYQKRDTAEIDEVINGSLEKITSKDLKEVLRVYEKDLHRGDKLLFDKLLPILGLEQNPPRLDYGESENGESGYYRRREHIVIVCEDLIRDKLLKGGEAPDDEKKLLFGLLKKREVGTETFQHINVVAHELWHAHQWAGEGVKIERRKKYRENFVYYMRGHCGYDAYRSQLIEGEAWEFGGRVETLARFVHKEGENK